MKTFLNILLCSLLLSLSVSQAFALAQEDAEAAAEEKYPLYQDGEEVVVVFGVGREPVKTYRGIYHPVGKTQIRIGRDTFKLKDLPERIRARFEPSLNARLRKEEVEHLMATEQSRSGTSMKSTSRNPVESSPSQVESLPVAPAVSSDAGGMREKAKEARAAADWAFKRCEELQIRQLCKDIMLDADLAFQHGREAYVSIKVGKDQAVANFQKAEQLCNQAIASGLSRLESDAREAMKNRQWEQARSHAVWAAKIDSTKGEELLLLTDHAEADWYWQCAEAAMKKRDWKLARENRKALSKLDQERGRELSSLINQTEAEYCYTQVAKGLQTGNTVDLRKQTSRLAEINGEYAWGLLIKAVEEIVEYAIAQKKWALAREVVSKLERDNNTLARELNAMITVSEADHCAQNAITGLQQNKGEIFAPSFSRLLEIDTTRAKEILGQSTEAIAVCYADAMDKCLANNEWDKARRYAQDFSKFITTEFDVKFAETINGDEYQKRTKRILVLLKQHEWIAAKEEAEKIKKFNSMQGQLLLSQIASAEHQAKAEAARRAEMERIAAAQRAEQARAANRRVCANCRGKGFVEGNGFKYKCRDCGGTGEPGFATQYIDSTGRHRSEMEQMIGNMMGTFGGGGGIFGQ